MPFLGPFVKKERDMRNVQISAAVLAGCLLIGCSFEDADPGVTTADPSVRRIMIDGSSTVEPITTRIAESFGKQFSDVRIPIRVSGTGTGMQQMIAGRIDIANASRQIKPTELEACHDNGIDTVELKVAIDGISVVVNPQNDWVDAMTVAQLRKLWEPGSTVKRWSDLDPTWPEEPISLFGPGEESGTFDYFTESINGKEDAITPNYSPSADDNVLVTGVAGNKYALGYFGYAYYVKNQDKLKALAISATDSVDDAVSPTPKNIESGAYVPLSRPLFIYVRKSSLQRPEVEDFVRYYLSDGQASVGDAGYVALSDQVLSESMSILEEALKSGS
jgi:phosphate transport system substrate-binding protein